jgi:hypothetical protein
MALVVGTAAVALATAHVSVVGRMRRLAPVVSRLGGAVCVVAGAYVAYYGAYELRVQRGADPGDPIVAAAADVQGWLADGLSRLTPAAMLAAFVVVLAAALLVMRVRGSVGRDSDSAHGTAPPESEDHRRETSGTR